MSLEKTEILTSKGPVGKLVAAGGAQFLPTENEIVACIFAGIKATEGLIGSSSKSVFA